MGTRLGLEILNPVTLWIHEQPKGRDLRTSFTKSFLIKVGIHEGTTAPAAGPVKSFHEVTRDSRKNSRAGSNRRDQISVAATGFCGTEKFPVHAMGLVPATCCKD